MNYDRTDRPRRARPRLVTVLALLALGWLAGNASPRLVRLPPEVERLLARGTSAPSQSAPSPPAERPTAEATLHRVAERTRALVARREAAAAALRETLIAYAVLLPREGEGAEVCRRLQGRQRRQERELGDIDAELADARRLEKRLRAVASGAAADLDALPVVSEGGGAP
jgi:hypothetical protein